ncbi:MAG: peptidylprolyl isomerase [Betaproteobacteria bacterium]|nr:peptidylprolyl isomerase [Betaproteobacteria bacterium]
MPTVQPGSYLTLHYRLRDAQGEDIINTFDDKPATLTLGTGQLAPPLEARLIGLAQGAQACVELAEGEAFGPHNPELVQRVSRKLLAAEGDPMQGYDVGDIVRFDAPDGGAYAGVVKAVHDDYVLFDFNHPLAGQKVTFEARIIGVL